VHNSRISPGGIDGEFMIQIVLKPGSGKPGGTGELRQSGFLEFLFFERGECFNIVDKLTGARRTENGKADFHIFAVILEPFGFHGQDEFLHRGLYSGLNGQGILTIYVYIKGMGEANFAPGDAHVFKITGERAEFFNDGPRKITKTGFVSIFSVHTVAKHHAFSRICQGVRNALYFLQTE